MSAILTIGPVREPVEVADLQRHLRLDSGDDDLLASLISAARMTIEAQSGLRLINQHWRMLIDGWPDASLVLPVRPVAQIVSVGLVGAKAHLPATAYQLRASHFDAMIDFEADDLPPPLQERFGIRIDMIAGYGADAMDVPADLRLAVLTLAAHWYDMEDWHQFQGRPAVPASVAVLVNHHCRPRL